MNRLDDFFLATYHKIRLWSLTGTYKNMLLKMTCSKTPPTFANYLDMSFDIKHTIPIVTCAQPILKSTHSLREHLNLKLFNLEASLTLTDEQFEQLFQLDEVHERGVIIEKDNSVYLVDLIMCYADILPLMECATHPPQSTN